MQSNPILDLWSENCYGAPPFESITPQHLLPALTICIHDAIIAINEICDSPEEPTFANTVLLFETDVRLEKFRQVRSLFISFVNTVQEFVSQKASGHELLQDFEKNECQQKILGRISSISTEDLASEDARLVRCLIEGFISRGISPSDDVSSQSETMLSLKAELVSLRSTYVQLIKDHMAVSTEFVLHNPSPSDAQLLSAYTASGFDSSLECCAGALGVETRYRVPNYPDVVDRLLSHCSERSVRESVWINFRNRGKPANYATARDILIARSKVSSMMGFENHAVFKMRHSMISDPTEVINLYMTLLQPAKRVFLNELNQLLEVSACDGIDDSRNFMQWDYKYYSEKLRKGDASLISFEEIPPFKLSEVMSGLIWLAQELYGFTMSPALDAPRYHDDVLCYSFKTSTGRLMGLMYVDVWTRPGKAPGNWTQQIIRPSNNFPCSSTRSRPVVSLNCNFKHLFADPEGLTFDHVKLVLHEFGHCTHCLFSEVKYASLSGMCTPDDHVELPSTLHEKFLQDPRFLSRITTAALPVGICNKLIANDCKSIGYTVLRSILSSILDLRLHTLPLHVLETLDIEAFEKNLLQELEIPPQIPFLYEASAFDHIFRFDYRYYMYIWSSVLVSSALSVFLRGDFKFETISHHEERGNQADAHVDQNIVDACVLSESRPDVCCSNMTPLYVASNLHDARRSVSGVTSFASASGSSSEVLVSNTVADCASDGLSLVHRAAGASFLKHVLSKGNSVDVWQGFLSFVGGNFDPTEFLRQRGLDSGASGFQMNTK